MDCDESSSASPIPSPREELKRSADPGDGVEDGENGDSVPVTKCNGIDEDAPGDVDVDPKRENSSDVEAEVTDNGAASPGGPNGEIADDEEGDGDESASRTIVPEEVAEDALPKESNGPDGDDASSKSKISEIVLDEDTSPPSREQEEEMDCDESANPTEGKEAAVRGSREEAALGGSDDDDDVILDGIVKKPVIGKPAARRTVGHEEQDKVLPADRSADDPLGAGGTSNSSAKGALTGQSSELTIVDVNALLNRALGSAQPSLASDADSGNRPLNLTKKPARPVPQLHEIKFPNAIPTPPKAVTPTPPLLKVQRPSSSPAPAKPANANSNAVLCDGVVLEDSDYVVEAASFVVPYLYQRIPKETAPKMWRKLRKEAKGAAKADAKSNDDSREEAKDDVKDDDEDMDVKTEAKTELKDIKRENDAEEKEVAKVKEEAKPRETAKKVAKKRRADDDEDWAADGDDAGVDSEDSDVDFDDEPRKKSEPQAKSPGASYFSEPIGAYLLDIGTSLVQEFANYDMLRIQKRKLEKDGAAAPPAAHEVIQVMTDSLERTREKNEHFKSSNKRCQFCPFRSTSQTVMDWHYEVPHTHSATSTVMRCNYCSFSSKIPLEVQDHFRIEHKRRYRPEKPEPRFRCPLCPWEDKLKVRFKRHMETCEKKFVAEKNLDLALEWDPPAKIPIPAVPPPTATPTGKGPGGGIGASAGGGANAGMGRSASSSSLSSLPGGAQNRSNYQFHPLVPKEHVKAANTIIAASARPTRPARGSFGSTPAAGAPGIPRMPNLPPPMIITPSNPALAFRGMGGKGSRLPVDPNMLSQLSRSMWTQQQQQAVAAAAAGNLAWLNSLQTNGQGVAMAGGTSISLVPSNTNSSRKSGAPSSSVTIRPIPGSGSSGSSQPTGGKGMSTPNLPFPLPASLTIQSLKGSSVQARPASRPAPRNLPMGRSGGGGGTGTGGTVAGPSPSVSITPLPNSAAAAKKPGIPPTGVNANAVPKRAIGIPPSKFRPGVDGKTEAQNPNSFVVCEICDGYIKDLEQLGNHLKWIHKVHLHPRLLQSRPPLNCQKCQYRFFTDQGLERHLLGAHGLVTSSMQDAANNNQDSGRCPICGKMYQWKLLQHVTKDHKMNLKPAHLSYKCTVCTATFSMYRSFEQHVYNEHSTLAKRQASNRQQNQQSSSGAGTGGGGGGASARRPAPASSSSSSSSGAGGGGNSARLAAGASAPVHISDEITIIPQSKSASSAAAAAATASASSAGSSSKQRAAGGGGGGGRPITIELSDEEDGARLDAESLARRRLLQGVPVNLGGVTVTQSSAGGRKSKLMPPMKRRPVPAAGDLLHPDPKRQRN